MSDRPFPARLRAWSGRLLLAAGLVVLLHRFDDGSVPRHPLFHPEAIYPAALYADLANAATWNVPFAPYFVPDMALFFLCMWTTGDPVAATYAFGALQFLLLVTAFHLLFGALLNDDGAARRLATRYAVLAGAWIVLLCSFNLHGGAMLLQLFVAAFHTGSFVLSIVGLALIFAILNSDGAARPCRAGLWVAVFLVAALGVLSDKLLLTVWVLPATASLLLARRRLAVPARALKLALVLAAGAVLGLAAVGVINSAGALQISTFSEIDAARYFRSLDALLDSRDDLPRVAINGFFQRLGIRFRIFWFLWLSATLALAFRPCFQRLSRAQFPHPARLSSRSRRNLDVFALYLVLSFALTALATSYVALAQYGAHLDPPTILFIDRYLISLYVTPLFAASLYAAVFLPSARASILELVQVAVLILLVILQMTRSEAGHLFPSYRPAAVDCLDAAAPGYNLNYGLAHFYRNTRTLNVFSRRGLHADQLTRGLAEIDWIDSRDRIGETAGYDFVITNGLGRRSEIVARLGEPDHELSCADWNVFVYDAPILPDLPDPTARAVRKTAPKSNSAPTGTSSTPSPGSPP